MMEPTYDGGITITELVSLTGFSRSKIYSLFKTHEELVEEGGGGLFSLCGLNTGNTYQISPASAFWVAERLELLDRY